MSHYAYNRIFPLLSLLLCFSSLNAKKTYTNKTFLATRSVHQHLTLTHPRHDHAQAARKASFGGTIDVSGFYKESLNQKELGKYFGAYAATENNYRDYIKVVDPDITPGKDPFPPEDLVADLIIHNTNIASNNFDSKVQLRPSQKMWGSTFSYYQDLSGVATGLFFSCTLPLIKIQNALNATAVDKQGAIQIADHPSAGKTFVDFLAGNVADARVGETQTRQKALQKAKIIHSQSRAGIADLALQLGWHAIMNKKKALALRLSCIVPTGNQPTGEFLFEPLVGNGKHWAFGGNLDARYKLFKNEHFTANLEVILDTHYLMPATEYRTLGLLRDNGSEVPFGYLYAIAEHGTFHAMPFANIATQALKVTPGLAGQGMINLNLSGKKIHCYLGYSCFAQQQSTVALKHAWQENTFGIVNVVSPLSDPFKINDITDLDQNVLGAAHAITHTNLNIDAAKTPALVTHTISSSVDYTASLTHGFMTMGIGGSYEYAPRNFSSSNILVWTRCSFTF